MPDYLKRTKSQKQNGPEMYRTALLVGLTGCLLACFDDNLFGQGQPLCHPPSVTPEPEPCGSGKVMTFVRVTNSCHCDVEVSVPLKSGGAAVFSNVAKNGGTARDMVGACSDKQVELTGKFSYNYLCPAPESKPSADIQRRLQARQNEATQYEAKAKQQRQQVLDEEQREIARHQSQSRPAPVPAPSPQGPVSHERQGSGILHCFPNFDYCLQECSGNPTVTHCTEGCRGEMIKNGRFCYWAHR
jgi:hypothetical protein